MTDKTQAERLRELVPIGRPITTAERFEIEQTGKEAPDALDAKDAEIARLRKALIRSRGAMGSVVSMHTGISTHDMRDAIDVADAALRK